MLRCWRQRVWWLPVVGPLIAAWIAGGEASYAVFFVLFVPNVLVLVLAPRWAIWTALDRSLSGLVGFVWVIALMVVIVSAWIVVMTPTVGLVQTSRLLGRKLDGGYLALASMIGFWGGLCFVVTWAFGRPRSWVARMLTETVRHPPSPNAMRLIRARLQVATEVLLPAALGLALTGWRVAPAGTVLISVGVPLLIAIAIRDRRQRKPTASAAAATPPRPAFWLRTQHDSQVMRGLVLLMALCCLLFVGGGVFDTGTPSPYIAVAVMFLWIAIWLDALDRTSRLVQPAVESSEPGDHPNA